MPITAERLEVDVQANTAKASRDLDQFDRKTKGITSTAGKMAKAAGAAFGGAALIGGIGKTINMAKNFDLTMRQVGNQTGLTGNELNEFKDLAIKMGAETAFSAQDASNAMLELAKGGLSAAEQKAGALQTTLTLAAAGGLDMASAAEYVNQGMTTFGIGADKANQVAVALAGGANASTASVESLGQALSQVGPGAGNAGMSLQETVAALSAFDNAGIKGSDAGTSLKTMLTSLTPATEAASGAMARYGLDFVKANGQFKSMSQVAGELKEGFKGVSESERTAAMATIFGSDATRAATVLMKNGSAGIRDYIKATKDKAVVEKAANTAMEGASGAVDSFMGSIETLGIKIGSALLPGFTKGTNKATEFVNKIGGMGDELMSAWDWAKGFADGFLAPFKPILEPMGGWLTSAKDGASGLGDALAPIGTFIANHSQAFGTAAGIITAVFIPAMVRAGAVATATKVKVVASWIAQSAASVKSAAMVGVSAIKVVAAWTMMAARSLAQAARMAASWVIAMGPVGWAIAAAVAVGVAIYKNWDKIVAATKRAWSAVSGAVSSAWGKIKGWAVGGAQAVSGAVSGAWNRVKSSTSAAWEAVKSKVKSAWDSLSNAVKSGVERVVNWVRELPGKAKAALGNVGSILMDAGTQIIQGLWDGLKARWESVKDWFGGITDAIPDLKGPRRKDRRLLIENGQAIMEGLKDGLNREWSEVKKLFKGMTKWIDSSAISDKVSKRLEGRIERVSDRTKRLLEQSKKVAADLADAVQAHDDAMQAKADFRDSAFQGMNAQANIMNAGNNGATIAASLRAQVAKVAQFAKDVATLVARGLNRDAISQITAAGVEGGAQVAAALAGATDTDLASINDSYAQIAATANSSADTFASQLHDAGIGAAQAVVDGLQARQAKIKDTLRTIAQSMLDEVRELVKAAVKAEEAAKAAEKPAQQAAQGTAAAASGNAGNGGGGANGERHEYRPPQGKTTGPCRKCGKGKNNAIHNMGGSGGSGGGPTGGNGVRPSQVSGGAAAGRPVNFNFTTHNPQAEPVSQTTNRALQRAAALGLV